MRSNVNATEVTSVSLRTELPTIAMRGYYTLQVSSKFLVRIEEIGKCTICDICQSTITSLGEYTVLETLHVCMSGPRPLQKHKTSPGLA